MNPKSIAIIIFETNHINQTDVSWIDYPYQKLNINVYQEKQFNDYIKFALNLNSDYVIVTDGRLIIDQNLLDSIQHIFAIKTYSPIIISDYSYVDQCKISFSSFVLSKDNFVEIVSKITIQKEPKLALYFNNYFNQNLPFTWLMGSKFNFSQKPNSNIYRIKLNSKIQTVWGTFPCENYNLKPKREKVAIKDFLSPSLRNFESNIYLKLLNKAIETYPFDLYLRRKLLIYYESKEEILKADKVIEELMDTRDDMVLMLFFIGEYFLRTGRNEEAKKYFEKAIHYEPKDAQVYLKMALYCRKTNDQDGFNFYFTKAKGLLNKEMFMIYVRFERNIKFLQAIQKNEMALNHYKRKNILLKEDTSLLGLRALQKTRDFSLYEDLIGVIDLSQSNPNEILVIIKAAIRHGDFTLGFKASNYLLEQDPGNNAFQRLNYICGVFLNKELVLNLELYPNDKECNIARLYSQFSKNKQMAFATLMQTWKDLEMSHLFIFLIKHLRPFLNEENSLEWIKEYLQAKQFEGYKNLKRIFAITYTMCVNSEVAVFNQSLKKLGLSAFPNLNIKALSFNYREFSNLSDDLELNGMLESLVNAISTRKNIPLT